MKTNGSHGCKRTCKRVPPKRKEQRISWASGLHAHPEGHPARLYHICSPSPRLLPSCLLTHLPPPPRAAHPQLPGPHCLVQPSVRPQSHPAAAAGRSCRRCCCRRRGQRAAQPLQAKGGPRQPTAARGGTKQLQRVSTHSMGTCCSSLGHLWGMRWQAVLWVTGRGMEGIFRVHGCAAAQCTFEGRGLQRVGRCVCGVNTTA